MREATQMHLFPLLVVPLFLVIYYTYKQLGMNSEVPIDPQARVDFWASQAMIAVRGVLVGCHFSSSSSTPELLYFRRKGQELQLASGGGSLLLKCDKDNSCSELATLGADGIVSYDLTSSYLIVQVLAGQDGYSKELQLRIPQSPA